MHLPYCPRPILYLFFSSKQPASDVHTKIFSAKIIHAINYLESLNRKINDRNALAMKKTNQKPRINSSLQVETKDTSLGAHIHDGQFLEPFYPPFENLPKAFSKVRFGVVENLLVASHEVSQINTLHAFDNIYDI